MNLLYEHLKQARKDAGISQLEVAKACKVSRNAVTQWEAIDPKKRTEPSIDKLVSISLITGWTISELVGGKKSIHKKGVPVISWPQAGEWNEAIDLFAAGYAKEYIAHINGGPNVYALRVQGHSMTAPCGVYPSFPEGYFIHVDPEQLPSHNDYVIARATDDDVVILRQYKEGETPYLFPLNPDYKPIFEEFRVLGRVTGSSMKL